MPDIFISEPKEATPDKTVESIPTQVPTTEKEKTIHPQRRHRLSAFSLYPDHIDFESRAKEEKVVLFLRQHIIVNVKWVLAAVIMIFVPTIAAVFRAFSSLPTGFELVITLSWYLVTLAYAFENFLNWYFNVYIVTNMRIVDVDFHNLIYKQVSDANLDKIQDVTYNMGGVARTIFNYGDVFIQTASEVSEFDFLAVPNPDRVVKIINDFIKKDEEGDKHK